jgi:hypothetical protein
MFASFQRKLLMKSCGMHSACMEEGYELFCRGRVDFGSGILTKVIMKEKS